MLWYQQWPLFQGYHANLTFCSFAHTFAHTVRPSIMFNKHFVLISRTGDSCHTWTTALSHCCFYSGKSRCYFMGFEHVSAYQEFEQPKTGFVVEGFGRVYEKQQHKSIQYKWVCLHRNIGVTIYTCQQTQAPQCSKKSSNLGRWNKNRNNSFVKQQYILKSELFVLHYIFIKVKIPDSYNP